MTIKELIETLQTLPPDMQIMGSTWGGVYPVDSIDELFYILPADSLISTSMYAQERLEHDALVRCDSEGGFGDLSVSDYFLMQAQA